MSSDHSDISTKDMLERCRSISSDFDSKNDQEKNRKIMLEVIQMANAILEKQEDDLYSNIRAHMYLAGAEKNLAVIEPDIEKQTSLNEIAFKHYRDATDASLKSSSNYIIIEILPWSMTFISKCIETDPETEAYLPELERIMEALADSVNTYKEECKEALDDLLNCQILMESLIEVENVDDREIIINDLLERTLKIKRIFLLYEENDFYDQANELFHKLEELNKTGGDGSKLRNYYFIDSDNQQQGPFTLDEIENEEIGARTLIWHKELEGWIKASEVEEFAPFLPPEPPSQNE